MKIRLSWVSWVAIGLFFACTGLCIYVMGLANRIVYNFDFFFAFLPFAVFSVWNYFQFIAQTKNMSRYERIPWILNSIASYALLYVCLISLIDVAFFQYENSKLMVSAKTLSFICIISSLALILISCIMIFWKNSNFHANDKTGFIKNIPSYMIFIFMVLYRTIIRFVFPIESVQNTIIMVINFILLIFIIVYIIIRTDDFQLVIRVCLAGFAIMLLNENAILLFGLDKIYSFTAIVFFATMTVAADIRLQIWKTYQQ
jgi:hypothetical protein